MLSVLSASVNYFLHILLRLYWFEKGCEPTAPWVTIFLYFTLIKRIIIILHFQIYVSHTAYFYKEAIARKWKHSDFSFHFPLSSLNSHSEDRSVWMQNVDTVCASPVGPCLNHSWLILTPHAMLDRSTQHGRWLTPQRWCQTCISKALVTVPVEHGRGARSVSPWELAKVSSPLQVQPILRHSKIREVQQGRSGLLATVYAWGFNIFLEA